MKSELINYTASIVKMAFILSYASCTLELVNFMINVLFVYGFQLCDIF